MSARLSPAASLLRNSKLFALPPAIALPATPPSSSEITSSNTATTVHPQYAAIETTTTSGNYGDWGFKRPLPQKVTKNTNNPVVRLVGGIDTREHIADFESAADHVLTLRKFEELDQPLKVSQESQRDTTSAFGRSNLHYSVFKPTLDNTTNLGSSAPGRASPSGVWPNVKPDDVAKRLPEKIQARLAVFKDARRTEEGGRRLDDPTSGVAQLRRATNLPAFQRRWRYAGPSLVQISDLEFDEYLHSLGDKELGLLRNRIKDDLARDKNVKARDMGQVGHTHQPSEISEEECNDYLRYLRNEPGRFGPLIAELLDLPEVKPPPVYSRKQTTRWDYGRSTLASPEWEEKGPPRTHPSAGLSYVQIEARANNHPIRGPQLQRAPVVARAVKTRAGRSGTDSDFGLAGFVTAKPETPSTLYRNDSFAPQSGGLKVPLLPTSAVIQPDGTLRLNSTQVRDHVIVDDQPVLKTAYEQSRAMSDVRPTSPAPRFSSLSSSAPRPRRMALDDPGQDLISKLGEISGRR